MAEKFVPWWEQEKRVGSEDTRDSRTRYGEDYFMHLDEGHELTSWEPQDLERAVSHPTPPEQPKFWTRDDGASMIYERRAHSFVGESESMKTWGAIAVAIDVASRGRGVVYVDCETSLDIFAGRVSRMGGDKWVKNMAYVRPDEPIYGKVGFDRWEPTEALRSLEAVFNSWHAELVVLDGVTELMAMHGFNINDAGDVARYHKILLRRWSGEIATLEVDHVAKGDFTGDSNFVRSALGSQHKRAGIDGASFLFTPLKKGGQGGVSTSLVKLVKDREGGVRNQCLNTEGDLGTFEIDSSADPTGMKSVVSFKRAGDTEGDLGMILVDAIREKPRGNKTLALDLHLDARKVRDVTMQLEGNGIITRGLQDRWFISGDEGGPLDLALGMGILGEDD